MTTMQTTTDIARWHTDKVRRRSGADRIVSKARLYRGLVTFSALLCLFRGTQMWIGYPTTQEEFSSVDPIYMQLIIYFLALLDIGLLALRPGVLVRAVLRANVFLLITLVLLALSVAASQDRVASARGIIAVAIITLPVLLYYLEFGAVRMQSLLRRWAMFAIVINIAYAAALPRSGFMAGSLAGAMRGMFLHKNLFGQYVAALFVIFLCSLTGPALRDRSRITDAVFVVLSLACVVLSHSSTAMIISAAGIFGLGLTRLFNLFADRGHRQLVVMAALLSVLFVVLVIGPPVVVAIVSSTGKDFTFSGRTRIWEILIPHIWDHPLTGHGFSLFRNAYYIQQYTQRLPMKAVSTHNTYLELLLTIGIPGTITWVLFILSRLVTKLMSGTNSIALRAAHYQEATIILMAMIGSFTEAGQMMAPLAIWPVLVGCLPLGRVGASGSGANGESLHEAISEDRLVGVPGNRRWIDSSADVRTI